MVVFLISFALITIIAWWVIGNILGFKASTFISILWIIACATVLNSINNKPTKEELRTNSENRKGVGYR